MSCTSSGFAQSRPITVTVLGSRCSLILSKNPVKVVTAFASGENVRGYSREMKTGSRGIRKKMSP